MTLSPSPSLASARPSHHRAPTVAAQPPPSSAGATLRRTPVRAVRGTRERQTGPLLTPMHADTIPACLPRRARVRKIFSPSMMKTAAVPALRLSAHVVAGVSRRRYQHDRSTEQGLTDKSAAAAVSRCAGIQPSAACAGTEHDRPRRRLQHDVAATAAMHDAEFSHAAAVSLRPTLATRLRARPCSAYRAPSAPDRTPPSPARAPTTSSARSCHFSARKPLQTEIEKLASTSAEKLHNHSPSKSSEPERAFDVIFLLRLAGPQEPMTTQPVAMLVDDVSRTPCGRWELAVPPGVPNIAFLRRPMPSRAARRPVSRMACAGFECRAATARRPPSNDGAPLVPERRRADRAVSAWTVAKHTSSLLPDSAETYRPRRKRLGTPPFVSSRRGRRMWPR